MALRYYKLPVEILNDPTWGMLPDKAWIERMKREYIHNGNIFVENPRPSYQFSRRLRRFIFRRDPNECAYCGSKKELQIDHIIPISRGGTNDPKNLQILCRKCNQSKGAKL